MTSIKVQYLALLALITAVGIVLSMVTVLGPNNFIDFWDDSYYVFYSHYIANYGFHNIPFGNFATEYILVGVPAILYKLFGVSLLTEGLLSMFYLVGTVGSVFLISKILHNDLAGILSALTFIFVPLVSMEGAASGDSMAVAFFSAFAVLLLLIGAERRQAIFYAMSGFIGLLGLLAGSALNLLVFLFIIPYLLYLLLKRKDAKQFAYTSIFFAGVVLAIALILLLGYVLQSNPTAYFKTNYSGYPNSTTPAFIEYIYLLFPLHSVSAGISKSALPFISSVGYSTGPNVIGFFGYATLISGIYLAVRRHYKALIPVAWFGLIFLYLSFGIDTWSGSWILYVARFSIILIPAMAVIIGIAFSMLIESAMAKRRTRKFPIRRTLSRVALLVVAVAYAILVINALFVTHYVHQANYIMTYQWSQIAKALSTLPQNASIYLASGLSGNPGYNSLKSMYNIEFPSTTAYLQDYNFLEWMAIEAYVGYNANVTYTTIFSNCSDINGDYIIGVNTSFYENNLPSCSNLTVYFSPALNPQLRNYAKLVSSDTQITLYKRTP